MFCGRYCDDQSVSQAAAGIDIGFLSLMYFRVALMLFVLGGAVCPDDGGIDEGAFLHSHGNPRYSPLPDTILVMTLGSFRLCSAEPPQFLNKPASSRIFLLTEP